MTSKRYLDEMLRIMAKMHISPSIIARVARMNPDPIPGERLRGGPIWTPRPPRWGAYLGKREFIRRFGRSAWDATPKHHKWRSGRRQYVSRQAVEDRAWEPWQGLPLRSDAIAFPVVDCFSNDKRGTEMKMLTREEFEQWRRSSA